MQKSKSNRKPFVEPSLTEEASLADVTLMSGGLGNLGGHGEKLGRGGHGKNKKGENKNKNTSHGHGRRS